MPAQTCARARETEESNRPRMALAGNPCRELVEEIFAAVRDPPAAASKHCFAGTKDLSIKPWMRPSCGRIHGRNPNVALSHKAQRPGLPSRAARPLFRLFAFRARPMPRRGAATMNGYRSPAALATTHAPRPRPPVALGGLPGGARFRVRLRFGAFRSRAGAWEAFCLGRFRPSLHVGPDRGALRAAGGRCRRPRSNSTPTCRAPRSQAHLGTSRFP